MTYRPSNKSITRLFSLFAGKTGGILVGIIFLPIYHQQLGNVAFGYIAIIASMQAFALTVDFGLSVLVARDVASGDRSPNHGVGIWKQAEALLLTLYVSFLFIEIIACIAAKKGVADIFIYSGGITLLLFTVLQNISQTALMAKKHFVRASIIQVAGVLVRAAVTVASLHYLEPSLVVFVAAQVLTTSAHYLITRKQCLRALLEGNAASIPPVDWPAIRTLLYRSRPLLLSGIAGASVMQLDKPIISAFVPAGDVSAYFLAMTFSALPASLLAGPVVQYFQPQIIREAVSFDPASPQSTVSKFTYTLICAVALPTWIIWHWADPIIGTWLKHSEQSSLVAGYAKLLLPAFMIGSLCYVPVVLLVAAEDFKYQAFTSTLMAMALLSAVAMCAYHRRIDLACYAYLIYFIAASASVWLRSLHLPSTRQLALRSATASVGPLLFMAIGVAAVFFVSS